jgi:hypothetical protein
MVRVPALAKVFVFSALRRSEEKAGTYALLPRKQEVLDFVAA